MKKTVFFFLLLAILFSTQAVITDEPVGGDVVVAQLPETVQSLKQRIADLLAQIAELQQKVVEMKGEVKSLSLELKTQLKEGSSGEEVKLLQEVLATDPEIYPENLITGYFGSLTKRAVKRFQEKAGLEQVGNVGPKTLSKINELLKEGAGNSGKVPPGLLTAPGIQKKLSRSFEACVASGNPVSESYPRTCTFGGRTYTEDHCASDSGKIMTKADAEKIAKESECGDRLMNSFSCNKTTSTYWVDLNLEKEGCSPACVVDIENKTAEINWRCTGLLVP